MRYLIEDERRTCLAGADKLMDLLSEVSACLDAGDNNVVHDTLKNVNLTLREVVEICEAC